MSRECCEFLDYKILAASNGGAVQLVMTGDAGGKAFLAEALGPMVTEVADAGACCGADEGVKAVAAANAEDCGSCVSKTAKASNVSLGDVCCEKGAKAFKAGNELPSCCKNKASKVVATKVDINDACCKKGVKAIKAGKAMPQCCLDNATTELE